MVAMEGLYIRTGNKLYENMAKFYTKIFALIFGLGVATGIVMEFEFGTNWATYSKYVGDVFGSALAAEGIFAFALEGDLDVSRISSNYFEMEWPPRSGKTKSFPEVEKCEWFTIAVAKEKINAAMIPLLDELVKLKG